MSVPQWTDKCMLFVYGPSQLYAYWGLALILLRLSCNTIQSVRSVMWFYGVSPYHTGNSPTSHFPTSQCVQHTLHALALSQYINLNQNIWCSNQQIWSPPPHESSWPSFPHELGQNCRSIWNIGWCFHCCCCNYHMADWLLSPSEWRNWVMVFPSVFCVGEGK